MPRRGGLRFFGLLTVMSSLLALATACDRSPLVGNDLEEAKLAIQERNWTLAERLLERCLRNQQDLELRWEAWQGLLNVAGSAGLDSRTTLDYLEAMLMEYGEDEAKTKQVLARMGELNEQLRRLDRAADAWSAYVDLSNLTDEEAVNGYRRLAQIYFRSGRFDAGEDVLQDCLSLEVPDRGKAQCLYDLADINMARERWKEATDLATQIMELDVDAQIKGLAAFLLGDALEQQRQFPEALAYFERARETYPNAQAVDNRIAYLRKLLKK